MNRMIARMIPGVLAALALVLTACHRADPHAADRLIEQASGEVAGLNFSEGLRLFDQALTTLDPASPAWPRATFGKAMCAQHVMPPTAQLIESSRTSFEALLAQAPDSPLAPRVTIDLGRLCELRDYPGDVIDLDGARVWYQKAIDRWPDSDIADEAALWLAGTYIQVTDDDAAVRRGVAMLDAWLARRPGNAIAATMWLYLADTRFVRLHEIDAALDCYIRADELGLPVETKAGAIYWRIAVLAEGRPGRLPVAVAYYQKIIRNAPTSGRAYEAQIALRRLAAGHPEVTIEVPPIRLFQASSGGTP